MHFQRKLYRKSIAGAVLLQVLLGLGLMVAMAPIVFNQIKKYNENIQQEEVVAQMNLLQKATSSYVSFDKNNIPDGCRIISGPTMQDILKEYGGDRIMIDNKFGQTYAFVTCKTGDIVEAAVFATGDMDDIGLNAIGQYLFDQGLVIAKEDKAEISNYNVKLSPQLKTQIVNNIGTNGAVVMLVSDAFFLSDFLHINKMPGSATDSLMVNTMLTDINMNNKNILNIKSADGTNLTILKNMDVAGIAGKNVIFNNQLKLNGIFSIEAKSDGISGPFLNTTMPIDATEISIFEANINGNVEVESVNLENGDLISPKLEPSKISVYGDVDVVESGSNWSFNISSITADSLDSTGAKGSIYHNISLKDTDSTVENYIYSGDMMPDGTFDDTRSSKLTLTGVSEVVDICWAGTSCLSEQIDYIYNRLEYLWEKVGER